LSEQFQNQIEKNKYHTVGTVPKSNRKTKNTTLSEHFFFFSIWFCICSDIVVFFVFLFDFGPVPTVWYFLFFYLILDLFRQCGICFFLFDFGTVPTVWYLFFSIWFWNCSDNVVFFVFLFDFGPVPTVWYFLFFYLILELFRQCGIFCFSINRKTKNTILTEQFQNQIEKQKIPHCRNSSKIQ
jgi:hypothetical protein